MRNFFITAISVIMTIPLTILDTALAASLSNAPISVSAAIENVLSLDVVINANGVTVNSANFGLLQPVLLGNGSKVLRSTLGNGGLAQQIVVLVTGSFNGGTPYTVTSTGTPLISRQHTIPTGSCTIRPSYTASNNGGAEFVGALGAPGTWTSAAGKTLYTSNATGSSRPIDFELRINDDPSTGSTAAVPSDQPAGIYNGTITFTITT